MRKPGCGNLAGGPGGVWTKKHGELKLAALFNTCRDDSWEPDSRVTGLLHGGKISKQKLNKHLLRSNLKSCNFGEDEEDLIVRLHALLGNRWSLIAGRLPGRTEKEVKDHWKSCVKKRLLSGVVDPGDSKSLMRRPGMLCNPHWNCLPPSAAACSATYSDDEDLSDACSSTEEMVTTAARDGSDDRTLRVAKREE